MLDEIAKIISDMDEICCGEFGEQCSKGILLTDYPLFITYQNVSMQDADQNWDTPSIILYASDDGTIDRAGLTHNYKEFCITRSDAYGIKGVAKDYQFDSYRTGQWSSWEDWLDKNKEGMTCQVMAVRCGQYVMIRMESGGAVITSRTVLPKDAGENIYIAITGEKCAMSDFSSFYDIESVEAGDIAPIVLKKPKVKQKKGDLPNLDCTGWWVAHTEGIPITEEPMHITFHSISYPEARENWNTPIVILFSALDRIVNGIVYTEYSITRSDAYGWRESADTFTCEAQYADDWNSWEEWLEDNKKGVECTVTAVRDVDTIIVTQENHGVTVTTYMDIPIDASLPVCLAISGELCSISNIRINR